MQAALPGLAVGKHTSTIFLAKIPHFWTIFTSFLLQRTILRYHALQAASLNQAIAYGTAFHIPQEKSMITTPERLTIVSQHALQAQIALLHELGDKVFKNGKQLLELNAQLSKTLLADSKTTTTEWLHSKHPFEFWTHRAKQLKPTMDHIFEYETQLAKLFSETQTQFFSYSLKEAVTLQDGLANLNSPKAPARPTESKPASKADVSAKNEAAEVTKVTKVTKAVVKAAPATASSAKAVAAKAATSQPKTQKSDKAASAAKSKDTVKASRPAVVAAPPEPPKSKPEPIPDVVAAAPIEVNVLAPTQPLEPVRPPMPRVSELAEPHADTSAKKAE